jgi:hypothetical protein
MVTELEIQEKIQTEMDSLILQIVQVFRDLKVQED